MMLLRSTLLLIPIILFSATGVHGQHAGSSITGLVFTPENEPSEYSTVVLMDRDSVFMDGTLTAADGSFLFDQLGEGQYFIMIRNVEFNTYVSDPIILGGKDRYEIESVRLEAKINDLDEVVIKGEKAMVEVHPDKMVFNVSSSPNSTGNNGLELLSKAPGVQLDMDQNIMLQGKSGVQIYINGRPSRISGSDLTNMLEGMQSENIESIELISNPSAKYDAEGTAGIINIILKKNLDSGLNGSVFGSYSKGVRPRTGAGASLNYNKGKVNLFSSLNLSDNDSYTSVNRTMIREPFQLDLVSEEIGYRKGINFSSGIDYQVNQEHLLSFDARVLVNDREGTQESNTDIMDLSGTNDAEVLVAQTVNASTSENYNANLHYRFTPNRSSELSADISFGYYRHPQTTSQPNEYYTPGQTLLLREVKNMYNTSTDILLFSSKIDYEKNLKSMSFQTGAKYSHITTDNQLSFYNYEENVPVLDVNRSNDFSYLEQVTAGYFILNATPLERISLSAGIRVENTASLGELVSANPGPDDVVPRNYTNFFPNVSLSYNDEETHALSISVGRRITRPNYQDLNPFEEKYNELESWKGNPFLEPNFIMNYQVTYALKRKLVISNTYSITNNYFARIFEVEGDKGSVLIPRNMDKVTNNGLSVSYPLKVFKWWEFVSYLNYNYATYGGDVEGTLIDLDVHNVSFRIQNQLKLPLGIAMELSYYITSPSIWRGTIHIKEHHRMGLGLKKQFFDQRLLLQCSVYDPFATGTTYYYSSDYGGMVVDGDIYFDSRRISFNARYSFGNNKSRSPQRKKSAIDEELQRISD